MTSNHCFRKIYLIISEKGFKVGKAIVVVRRGGNGMDRKKWILRDIPNTE